MTPANFGCGPKDPRCPEPANAFEALFPQSFIHLDAADSYNGGRIMLSDSLSFGAITINTQITVDAWPSPERPLITCTSVI
ncbi:hypothetical protein CKAH01_18560 [Colletotrichum kahawae]|uniref:Uncharacterized protein n=1 Tax=Colletotrichum kahawae TaxID=34407 RepID=A0AAE0D2K2_COLKA|nr:hypothetical protein CKAH01_18560 [Colletotrichum kahawae]